MKKVVKEISMKSQEQVADSFVRFLIGNRKTALRELQSLIDEEITPDVFLKDPADYNTAYKDLYYAIFNAISDVASYGYTT